MLGTQGCGKPQDNSHYKDDTYTRVVKPALAWRGEKWIMSVTFPNPFNNTRVGGPTLNAVAARGQTEFITNGQLCRELEHRRPLATMVHSK